MDVVLGRHPSLDRLIQRVFLGMLFLTGVLFLGVLLVQVAVVLKGNALLAAAQKIIAAKSANAAFNYRQDWFHERVVGFAHHYRLTNFEFWLPALCLVVGFAVWRNRNRRWLSINMMAIVLILGTVLDLFFMGRVLVPQIDLKRYPLTPVHPVLEPILADNGMFRVHRWGREQSYVIRPNLFYLYGKDDLWGAFSLSPESVESLFPMAYTNGHFNSILDVQNVKYLIVPQPGLSDTNRFELLAEGDGLLTYRNRHCNPRAQFISHWELEPQHSLVPRRLAAETFNPAQTVVLEEVPLIPTCATNDSATIQIKRYDGVRVVINLQCQQPGMLLLSDTYVPEWKARVDGEPTKVYRANYTMRAVPVQKGSHVVEFRYEPLIFWIGATISGGTLVVLVVGLAWLWIRQLRLLSPEAQ